ncbi:MAG: hypothetical protein AB7V14_01115 [Kiritimatiellia bacterium]
MNPRTSRFRFGLAGGLLLAGVLLWMATAWPLPRFFSEAIPHTNLHLETQTLRPIASGDHLQLLYHFWLGLDAFSGHSPFFHNVYEFNLGDDSARIQPDLYYLPFSLVYAALAPWAGHAAGWNAAGLASVLIGILFLGLLVRRFAGSTAAILLATLLAASFPYRWITLFTGSPTGFAMAFPPMLFYGLDRAIRDRSPGGGVWAGLAILGAYATDLHTFYFSALAAPAFALLSFWMVHPAPRRWHREIPQVLPPLLPFAAFAAAAVGISTLMTSHLSESVMASGRSLAEMASYSPPARGLVSTAHSGMGNHVYFGIPLFALLAALLLFWLTSFLPRGSADARPSAAERLAVFGLFAAIAVAILLALGIHGPFEGIPVRAIRKIVPRYTMIRQTVKIYCLMPALLAPLLGLLFARTFAEARRSAFGVAAAALVLILSAWTFCQNLAQTTPGFCRLPRANAAYAAVAADDKANDGRPAHALALPLWPGDSHWTSLCEYAIMLSRVRLVNGYAPAVPSGYFQDVFKKYESLNQGYATDEQLDALLGLGVRHLLFHANAYPDKISPFPAAAALRSLTAHPRLALLADDGLVFAFRILPKHPVEHVPHANWPDTLYAAARHWPWNPPREILREQTAPLLLRAPVFPAPNLRYLLRLSDGSAQPLLVPPGRDGVSSLTHPIPGLPDWLQADLPCPTGGLAEAVSGDVVLKHALLAAGELPAPGPDGSIRIPPALLFHWGHASPGQDDVAFDPETVPVGQALYGPNLPVPPGVYDIALSYAVPAGTAASPGIFRVLTLPGNELLAEVQLDPAGESLVVPALSLGADPLRLEFHYTAAAAVVLRGIRLSPSTLRLRHAAP